MLMKMVSFVNSGKKKKGKWRVYLTQKEGSSMFGQLGGKCWFLLHGNKGSRNKESRKLHINAALWLDAWAKKRDKHKGLFGWWDKETEVVKQSKRHRNGERPTMLLVIETKLRLSRLDTRKWRKCIMPSFAFWNKQNGILVICSSKRQQMEHADAWEIETTNPMLGHPNH